MKRCYKCGGGIYEGDEYLMATDGPLCRDCLEELSVEEWLEIYEDSLSTAE